MKSTILKGGIWPVMITPFREDLAIDYDGLSTITDFYLENGASGLFANCLSSEMYQLDEYERLELIEAVVKRVNGRVPVVATGTFGGSVNKQINFIRSVYELGVKSVIIITSQLIDRSGQDDLLELRINEIVKKTDNIPLGLYECPDPFKRLIPPEMLGRLASTNRFLYFKDTSCNLDEIRSKLHAIRDTSLGLFNANTPTALDSLVNGAIGLSPVSANFYPEFYYRFYQEIRKSGINENTKRMQHYLTVMDAVTRIKYPLSAKIFLKMRGLNINNTIRVPLDDLNDEEWKMIGSLYAFYQEVRNEFKI